MAALDFSGRGGVAGKPGVHVQEHKAGSVVQSVGLHILTKTVSDFVTLSESGRLQAGSILWREKKNKKTTETAPGAVIKLPTTRNLTVSEREGGN